MTVDVRQVNVGQTVNNETEVLQGLSPGETVVTDGQVRLIPGTDISPRGSDRAGITAMNLCEPFIRRPVMTSLVMLAILLFGILGYRDLAVSDLPNVDFPTIQVYAGLPGASPETMASSVATPLEKQFTTIAGLDSMTSTSSLGSIEITRQFNLSRNIDSAALDVQSAISAAANQLPPNLPSPPTFRKVNPADQAIFLWPLPRPHCRSTKSISMPKICWPSRFRWCPATPRPPGPSRHRPLKS